MRDAILRAWDKVKKEMYVVKNMEWCFYINKLISIDIHDKNTVISVPKEDLDNIILIPNTRLEDRSGTDIYKNDILEFVNEDLERVVVVCKIGNIRMTTDSGDTIDVQCVYFETKDGSKRNPVVWNQRWLYHLENMEIIGNIYETPELLEVRE